MDIGLILISIVSLFIGNFSEMLRVYIDIKACFIEIPAGIFEICNWRRPKNGVGVEWKFVLDYQNRRKH